MKSPNAINKKRKLSANRVHLAVLLAFCGVDVDEARANGCSSLSPGTYTTGVVCRPNSGDAEVTVHSGTEFNININSGTGIYAVSSDGGATVTAGENTLIKTLGNASIGVYAKGDRVNIDSRLTIISSAVGLYGTSGSGGDVHIYQSGGSIDAGTVGIFGVTSGSLDINNSGAIHTASSHGIYAYQNASNSTAAVKINNMGTLTVDGGSSSASARGIIAYSLGSGEVTITGNGNIAMTNVDNQFGYGVMARPTSGNATIDYSGSVTTYGYDSSGLRVYTDTTGNASVKFTGQKIEVFGDNADTLYAYSKDGTSTVIGQGELITHADDGNGRSAFGIVALTSDKAASASFSNGRIDVIGTNSSGFYVASNSNNGTGAGSVSVTNGGEILARGPLNGRGIYTETVSGSHFVDNSGDITTYGSRGIGISNVSDNGAIWTNNSGAITTEGNDSHGIGIASQSGTIALNNRGEITTQGDAVTGLNTRSNGDISIINTGPITTQSYGARGIDVYSSGSGSVNIISSGTIATHGSDLAAGILVNSPLARISSNISGNITTVGANSSAVELTSTRSAEGSASSQLYYHDGTATVGAGSNAISLWGNGAATGSGEVYIGTNTHVDASRGLAAVQSLMAEDSLINIANGAQIDGGTVGIATGGQRITLNTAGVIGSMNDLAILNRSYPTVTERMEMTNQRGGTITGYLSLGSGTNALTNDGLWNLRNFADTDGDLNRDTLAVAVSDFGSSGNNRITNRGTMSLLGDEGLATTLNDSGAYGTGYIANSMALGKVAQGQILNVGTFINSGTIDLSQVGSTAGSVLVISGGSSVGVSGNGTYITNGGSLVLNTALNEDGANSQSDMLIVDGAQRGANADKITIINAGGAGSLTAGNGIELVRVLDKDRSESSAFQLAGRVVSVNYEYELYHNGVGADAADGNWYLRSLDSNDRGGDASNADVSKPAPRVETSVYLRNMSAASTMFVHTLHDRRSEQQNAASTDANLGWVRIVSSHTNGSANNGRTDLDTDTALVHLGSDLARWSNNGDDSWRIGLMGAYGQSNTDANLTHNQVANNGMRRTASGKVEGYSIGMYATWFAAPDSATGPYVDLWSQNAWYKNSVRGNGLKEENYNSTGWTASLETGYAFIAHDGEKRQWLFEPQAQMAYNAYRADDHYEQTTDMLATNGDNSGVITRLGMRAYSRTKQDIGGISPFVEANWWRNGSTYNLSFNGQRVSDDTPENTYELKIGLQSGATSGWQLWGHVGGRWGEDNYSSYQGMVGIEHTF